MKSSIFVLCFLIGSINLSAQDFPEQSFKSKTNEITLFLKGAQVFETASGTISEGESIVLIKGLSPYLDEKSIQVKGQGDFTIQSVNKRLDFLEEKELNQKSDELESQIEVIQQNQELEKARLEVLAEKISLLNANKNLGGTQAGPNLTEFRQALEFYENQLTEIKAEEIEINSNLLSENQQIERLRNQIRAMMESDNKSTSEIRIRIKAPSAGSANFEINYLVANAGWYPKYDVRVKDVNNPLSLNYKAEVYQNTGVDWNDVKLRFSNANPNQSGQAPSLEKWELNYARLTVSRPYMGSSAPGTVSGLVLDERSGQPIPGTSVMVKGSTIGTVTDTEGRYSLSIPQNAQSLVFSFIGMRMEEKAINNQSTINAVLVNDEQMLQEVVVVGYGASEKRALTNSNAIRIRGTNSMDAAPIQTTIVENQTTVEIEVADPYSIKSNGEKTLVDLKTYDVPANYRYSVIPKLDNDAFLIAEVADWSQYSLLEGESNLYFEDGFVGRSILNASELQDTLQISMGRDRSIVVQREKMEEFSRKRTIGSNITETRGYEITLRNNKSLPVTLTVEDQIPVSVNSQITVSPAELNGGNLNPDTGKIKWEVTLNPGDQQKISFSYEVKYPKSERIILD